MTWSDDDSTPEDDSSEDMMNLALVGIDDESVQGNSEVVYAETDFEEDQSEVNSFKYYVSSDDDILESLTMQEHNSVTIEEHITL